MAEWQEMDDDGCDSDSNIFGGISKTSSADIRQCLLS